MTQIPEGSVHGRFQPFHLGHLRYVLEAKQRCDFLWVGITQFDIHALLRSLQPHRQEPASNPLTFFERVEMISNVLRDYGISHTEYSIVPFPIDVPETLTDFIPTRIPIYTTICEPWNNQKIDTLEKFGYKVIVLWKDLHKQYSGSIIRGLIASGDMSWKQMVPNATAVTIEQYEIRRRLLNLMSIKP